MVRKLKKQTTAVKPIWEAAIANDWYTVRELLQHDPSLINVICKVENCKVSLLHLAIKKNPDMDLLKYLVSLGANVNAQFKIMEPVDRPHVYKEFCTPPPLHLTIVENYNAEEIVQFLVSKGVDVNRKDHGCGGTPLHYAATKSNVRISECLILAGANANAEDRSSNRPLHVAAATNPNVDVLKCLITAGADIHARLRYDKSTPLHIATQHNSVEVVQHLILQGANVHAKDRDGKTPLDYANTEQKKRILREAMDRKTN